MRGLKAADVTRQAGGKVILDPAPAPAGGLSDDVFARVDVITPNETETALLTGLRPTNPDEAAKAAEMLRRKGVSIAVVKLGAQGVYFKSDTEEGFVPPFKVTSVDTVAAGDCFNGGLAVALSEGQSLADAVRLRRPVARCQRPGRVRRPRLQAGPRWMLCLPPSEAKPYGSDAAIA